MALCVDRLFLGQATWPTEVAEEWDVTWEVAERALILLGEDAAAHIHRATADEERIT